MVRDTVYIPIKDYPLCNGSNIEHARASLEGVSVGTLTKDTLKLMYVDIYKGRMPKNNKEIILSNFYDYKEHKIKIGDTIQLKNKNETATYTVVGYYTDSFNSNQWAEFESGSGIYSALTIDKKVEYTDKGTMYVRARIDT